jgi:AcrR family transcriptional regulator
MKKGDSSERRGRPRAFDADEALDRAMQLFWHKGYEGTSLSDLTGAMGINRPSLYAAFGDKEALFRKVLDRYDDEPLAFMREALTEPTARVVIERLLRGAVKLLTDPHTPQGCLMVQGALACGEGADAVRREMNARRAAAESALRRRLVRAKAEGDLPPDASPVDLALYVVTVVRGMAVQAAGGAGRAELLRVVRTALRAWPE